MILNSHRWRRPSWFLNAHPVAGTLLCAVLALTAPAANVYWSGAGDGTSWSDPANWQGGAVRSGTSDIAYFSVRNNGILLDYSGTFTIRQLYFYVPTTLTIPAGCTLYLSNSGGAVLDATAEQTADTHDWKRRRSGRDHRARTGS